MIIDRLYNIWQMSAETDRWIELGSERDLLYPQLSAAAQTAFSPEALKAGIVPLTVVRYSFQFNDSPKPVEAIMWPDAHEDADCIVMGSAQARTPVSFVRAVPDGNNGYFTEGIALHLRPRRGVNANLYGAQHVIGSPDQRVSAPAAGVTFLANALQQCTEVPPPKPTPAHMVGIEGRTTGRLFKSLSSLAANLVVDGALNETATLTSRTYDLAKTLLKTAVASSKQDEASGGNLLVSNGAVDGVVFKSREGNIVVIRQAPNYPATVTIATAEWHQVNDGAVYIQQYSVRSKGTTIDTMVISPDEYNPASMVHKLQFMGAGRKENDIPLALSAEGCSLLEQKMVALLSERLSNLAIPKL